MSTAEGSHSITGLQGDVDQRGPALPSPPSLSRRGLRTARPVGRRSQPDIGALAREAPEAERR
jgi:hypothetical protein